MNIQLVNELPSLEEYKFLRSSVGWKLIDEAAMLSGIGSSNYCVLAKSKGRTVGMGRIVGDGGVFFLIVDVIVIPGFQGKGIGKAVVQNLLDWIKVNCSAGSRVWLCAAEGREGFYEKFGFEQRPKDGFGAGMQWIWEEEKR